MQETLVTGAGLRRRLDAATPRPGRRRRGLAVGLLLGGLGALLVTPALAGNDNFHLQGSDLRTEFVFQPYWLAPGTLGGEHLRLEAGLLGFRDEAGTTAMGYCVDARTHRRHDAVYRDGELLAQADVRNPHPVLWLLGHAFPNGPSLLGSGAAGGARSSSVVQAAIWHFSDDFNLDPAGAAGVDAAYRAAYDDLLRQAAAGADGAGPDTLTLEVDALATGGQRSVRLTLRAADGAAVPDGTEVTISADMPLLRAASHDGGAAQVRVSTHLGVGQAWLAAPAGAARVVIRAETSRPVAPGRVLVASVATQRLVETSWGQEVVRTETAVEFAAPTPTPTPTAPPREIPATSRPTPTPTSTPTAAAVTPAAPTPSSPPTLVAPAPSAPLAMPALPSSAVGTVSMPATGRPMAAPLARAAALILGGSGVLMALGRWPATQGPRQVRYQYRAPMAAVSGCARPSRTGRCPRP